MNKYIAPESKAFAHLDRLAAWQAGAKPAPVTLEWDLSFRCYLGCVNCHFAYTHTKGPWAAVKGRALPVAQDKAGDLADYALVRRVLGEVSQAGVQGVVWTGGGEPTTHPQWRDIVTYAATRGLQQGMYTAGGLLTRDDARLLAEHATWVVVSLDAHDPESYAREKRVSGGLFLAALNGIRWIAEAGGTVGASFLLHGGNWREAPQMLAVAREAGATYTTFRPTIQTSPADPATCTEDRGWITDAVPMLQALAHEPDVETSPERFLHYQHWARGYDVCHGIKLNATITPDGRVWVCPNRREMKGSCIGDLREQSFAEVWAKHPGHWTDFAQCRVMCRLHAVNQSLAPVFTKRQHEAFI